MPYKEGLKAIVEAFRNNAANASSDKVKVI